MSHTLNAKLPPVSSMLVNDAPTPQTMISTPLKEKRLWGAIVFWGGGGGEHNHPGDFGSKKECRRAILEIGNRPKPQHQRA